MQERHLIYDEEQNKCQDQVYYIIEVMNSLQIVKKTTEGQSKGIVIMTTRNSQDKTDLDLSFCSNKSLRTQDDNNERNITTQHEGGEASFNNKTQQNYLIMKMNNYEKEGSDEGNNHTIDKSNNFESKNDALHSKISHIHDQILNNILIPSSNRQLTNQIQLDQAQIYSPHAASPLSVMEKVEFHQLLSDPIFSQNSMMVHDSKDNINSPRFTKQNFSPFKQNQNTIKVEKQKNPNLSPVKTSQKIGNDQLSHRIKEKSQQNPKATTVKSSNHQWEEENNKQQSLTSQSLTNRIHQNEIIHNLSTKKYPEILWLLNLFINGRFVTLVLVILTTSTVISFQISIISSNVYNPLGIGNLMKIFSQFCLYDLKVEEMAADQFDPSIKAEFLAPFKAQLTDLSNQFALEQHIQGQLLDKLGGRIHNNTITSIIFFQQQYYFLQIEWDTFKNYKNRFGMSRELPYFQYINQILNAVLGVVSLSPRASSYASFFVHMNYPEYADLMFEAHDIFVQDLFDMNYNLQQEYIALLGLMMACLITVLILIHLIVQRILGYKEKVLLLLSRLSLKDIEREIYILNICKSFFQDTSQSWQKVSFSAIVTQEKGYNQQQQRANKRTEKEDQKFKQKNADKKSSTKYSSSISSSLQGQKLQSWKLYLIISSDIILCGVFFMSTVFMAYLQSQSIEPSLVLLNDISEFYQSFNSAVMISELLSNEPFILKAYPTYPMHDPALLSDHLDIQVKRINKFTFNIMQHIDNLQSNYNEDKILFRAFYGDDLCQQFLSDPLCDPNRQSELAGTDLKLRNQISTGISGIITSYLLLFNNVQTIYKLNLSNSDKALLMEQYLTLYQNLFIILTTYEIPMKAITLLFTLVDHLNSNSINNLITLVVFYFIIIGAIIIFIQLLLDITVKNYMRQSYQWLNFSLTFIPLGITQEETTAQILKSIYTY